MKIHVFVATLFFSVYANAQPDWKCIYVDSTFFYFTDSALLNMADNVIEQNLPGKVTDSVRQKIIESLREVNRSNTPYNVKTRYVTAGADSTLIEIELTDQGTLRIKEPDEMEELLKKDELYFRSRSGRYDSLQKAPRRSYKSSGRETIFFNYICKEYISSDSTYTIWVAGDLPSFINPGIRTGGIKGAILFYEAKYNGMVTRGRITKLTKNERKI